MTTDPWSTVKDVATLVVMVTGLPAIILALLGRRNANKKIDQDERTTEANEFSVLSAASMELVKQGRQAMVDAQAAAKEAKAEISKYKSERDSLHNEMAELIERFRKLRDLFKSYVTRTGVPLNTEEQAVFDTIDPRTLPRRRKR